MEAKSNKGGKRDGAGRKAIGNDKKVQISLYVPGKHIWKWGNDEKMKTYLYQVIENYEKEPPVVQIQDLNKQTNVVKPIEPQGADKSNYSIDTTPKVVQPLLSPFDAFRKEILAATIIPEIVEILKRVKATLMTGREKQQLESIAKEHSKTMYND